MIQQWWESWGQRLDTEWTFPILLMMLGGPIGLYIISHLLYPKEVEHTDFKAFYYENPRIIYLIAAATTLIATVYRPVSFGDPLLVPDNYASAIVLLFLVVLAFTRNKVVHEVLVSLVFIAVLGDVLTFNFSL